VTIRRFIHSLLSCVAAFVLLVPALAPASEDTDDHVTDEVVFQLNQASDLDGVLSTYNLTIVPGDTVAGVNTYLARAPSGTDTLLLVQQMLDPNETRIAGAEEAHLAEAPEARFRTLAIADGNGSFTKVRNQAAFTLVGADQTGWTGQGVIVAVLDTGVGPHPDLNAALLPGGHDFIDGDAQPADDGNDIAVGHGTHVAGIIHAIAPGAKILPVRVLNSAGQGSVFAIAEGIHFAVDYTAAAPARVRVINLSLGLVSNDSPSIQEALQYAFDHQVVVVAAAGNHNLDTIDYPAKEGDTIAVAATDLNDHKADFSNFNDKVDITAPGVDIQSMFTGQVGPFVTWSGTSMSAPFVSGAAALTIQARPSFTKDAIENLLFSSAKNISSQNPGFSGLLGHGRLDITALLQTLGPTPTPSPTPIPVPAPSGSNASNALLGLALCLLTATAVSRRRQPEAASPPAPRAARPRTS
jgi:subtilisin family serine protease